MAIAVAFLSDVSNGVRLGRIENRLGRTSGKSLQSEYVPYVRVQA